MSHTRGWRRVRTAALLLALSPSTAASGQVPSPSHAVTSAGSLREVARVNGVVLLSDRLAAAVNARLPMESFHRNVSEATLSKLRREALDQLIDDELQFQDGTRLHLSIAPRELDAAYAAVVTRYGGPARFASALAQAGATANSARREVHRSLVIARAYRQAVTAQCQVTRTEALRFFTEHPERFVEPEQLHVHAITIGVDPSSGAAKWQAARDQAEQLHQEIEHGASFADIARQHSTDPSRAQGGDMGYLHRGSLAPQFETVARDLPVGRLSGVIETIYGYHLIKVSEIRPARARTFAAVASTLTTDLTTTRCKEVNDAWIHRLRARAAITVGD